MIPRLSCFRELAIISQFTSVFVENEIKMTVFCIKKLDKFQIV